MVHPYHLLPLPTHYNITLSTTNTKLCEKHTQTPRTSNVFQRHCNRMSSFLYQSAHLRRRLNFDLAAPSASCAIIKVYPVRLELFRPSVGRGSCNKPGYSSFSHVQDRRCCFTPDRWAEISPTRIKLKQTTKQRWSTFRNSTKISILVYGEVWSLNSVKLQDSTLSHYYWLNNMIKGHWDLKLSLFLWQFWFAMRSSDVTNIHSDFIQSAIWL